MVVLRRLARSTVMNNVFVTMADEDATTSTFLSLRSLTFKGESVKARIKSEHVLRGSAASTGACVFNRKLAVGVLVAVNCYCCCCRCCLCVFYKHPPPVGYLKVL